MRGGKGESWNEGQGGASGSGEKDTQVKRGLAVSSGQQMATLESSIGQVFQLTYEKALSKSVPMEMQ